MPKPSDIPRCTEIPSQRSSGRTTSEYQISLATPLFGGGVEAGRPDDTLPIRGTAIRGQLQFWWRATRGAEFATCKDLFVRHTEVWGTTDKASPVQIHVRDVAAASPKPCAEYAVRNDGKLGLRWRPPFDSSDRVLPYALFPFQGQLSPDRKTIGQQPAQFIPTGSFTLRVHYPKRLRQDVETAVRAWVNFGGLGARTRRGCGALLCKELAWNDGADLKGWFRAGVMSGVGQGREWPTLPSSVLVGSTPESPIEAWKKVISELRHFRQGVGFARNPGQQSNRPGRSRYPEPETIRRVTGMPAVQLARLQHIPDAFPRAELGLPIVFHFQGNGEPPDTVLYPAAGPNGIPRERMASPLILKPLALANGKAVPLIMRLMTPSLMGVELKLIQGSESVPVPLPETTVVRDGRLATYRDSPLSGTESGSALEAFFLQARRSSQGFHEVTW